MIFEFLYCGYETVINLSGEGDLETEGWGMGGVSGLPKFILNIKVDKVVIKAATERSANYTFSDCLFLLMRIGAKFLACTCIVLMVGK